MFYISDATTLGGWYPVTWTQKFFSHQRSQRLLLVFSHFSTYFDISVVTLILRYKLMGLVTVAGTHPTSKRSKLLAIGRFGGLGCTIWGTSFQGFPPSSKFTLYTNGQDIASIVGLFGFYLPPVLYELLSVNQSKKICFWYCSVFCGYFF